MDVILTLHHHKGSVRHIVKNVEAVLVKDSQVDAISSMGRLVSCRFSA